jgi:hypothetical protein
MSISSKLNKEAGKVKAQNFAAGFHLALDYNADPL